MCVCEVVTLGGMPLCVYDNVCDPVSVYPYVRLCLYVSVCISWSVCVSASVVRVCVCVCERETENLRWKRLEHIPKLRRRSQWGKGLKEKGPANPQDLTGLQMILLLSLLIIHTLCLCISFP